jgi:hypothetical protein
MKNQDIIHRYGGVVKEEPLSCVENDILIKNTCVLEAVSPYFGYYNEVKQSTRPQMLYFVLDGYFPLETLIRTTSSVQKQVNFPIDAVTGSINMFGQTCYVIRLLNIQNYSQIAILQEMYMKHGVSFKKKTKSFTNEMALIKLRRFFSFSSTENGLYFEYEQPNFGYFEIPKQIPWEKFKALTKEVKFDTNLLYFDAATAYFYINNSITDLVRVYRENLTSDKLIAIRDRYIKLVE